MNATQLAAFRTQAQDTAEALFPGQVVIAGVTYSGSVTGIQKFPRETGDGGHIEVREFTSRIQRTLFAAAGKSVPKPGQMLTHRGETWKIEFVRDEENDVAVSIRAVCDVERG